MLIDHQFVAEGHIYKVPNRSVLCLSDIISLNGLTDGLNQIPFKVLAKAALRGNDFDKAVQVFMEEGKRVSISSDSDACLDGFHSFMSLRKVSIASPLQRSMVWVHRDSSILLGCTPDLPLLIDGEPWIVDTKTTYPTYGVARKQKDLAWKIQLQGQQEAFRHDAAFEHRYTAKKAILHCHPKLKNGYSFIPFLENDTLLFDAMVRVAVNKLAAGFTVERR